MDYKQAGVDIERADAFVETIKKKVQSTYNHRVLEGVGGFAGLYRVGEERLLAVGADGVGTKILLACEHKIHTGIGIDLVAMCVNDIVCTGARPLFFMDYLAMGQLNPSVGEALLDSIVEGCRQSECALLGGETAEMPGMYPSGEYDLAGFAVGEISSDKLLGGKRMVPGMSLIGLMSSGFHSNGYSLVRKVLDQGDGELIKELLTPTRIYWPRLKELLKREWLAGIAHITGGGFLNIARMNPELDYHLDHLPDYGELPGFFQTIVERTGLSERKLYKTFNMGVGMVLATEYPEKVEGHLEECGESFWRMGETVAGSGRVFVKAAIL